MDGKIENAICKEGEACCDSCGKVVDASEMHGTECAECYGSGPDYAYFNFYGVDRFKVAGKHPSEMMAEGEYLTFTEAEEEAEYLSEAWKMDVEVMTDAKICGRYSAQTGFVWTR